MSICSILAGRARFVFRADVSRPLCPRHISHVPPSDYFKPAGIPLRDLREEVLGADEMEAVRLADVEGLYRAEGAERMKVSRQTFDRILKRGRSKIARALIDGQALRIERVPGALHKAR
jgi:predicted DNA-binding protein (UPF0251 family)